MEDYNYPYGEYQRPERVVEQIIFDQTEGEGTPQVFTAYVVPMSPLVLLVRISKGYTYSKDYTCVPEATNHDDMIALWQAALRRYEQWKAALPEGVKSRRDSRTHDDVPF